MPEACVTLRLPVCRTAPRAARRGVVAGLDLEGPLAASAALLVSEAVTNSVLHAGLEPDDLVQIEAYWVEEGLRIEVCDEGAGMAAASPAGPRDGGHGLNLIGGIAERWGVTSNGHTRVWFELAA